MKTDNTPERTTDSVDDDLDPLDTHVRIWLAEHNQGIARRGRHLVHRSGRGPWQPLAPSDLADAITATATAFGEPLDAGRLLATADALHSTAPRIDPPNVVDLGRIVRVLTRSITTNRITHQERTTTKTGLPASRHATAPDPAQCEYR